MTQDKIKECARRCRDAAGQMAMLQAEDELPSEVRYHLTKIMRFMSELRGWFDAQAGRTIQKPGGPLKRRAAR